MGEALGALTQNRTLDEPLGTALQQRVGGGAPLFEAIAEHPDTFTPEEVALVEAGETSGRLDETLERLAQLRQERREARRALLTEAWYPILLAHLAVVMLPIARLGMAGELTLVNWLREALALLLPAYAVYFGVRYLSRSAAWRERFCRFGDRVPGFGKAARHRRRATFASVLEATYSAGIPVDRCLLLAGKSANLPEMQSAAGAVAAGEQLTPSLTATGLLPSSALSRLSTGEQAGDLSRALKAIATEESAEARAVFRRAMITLGKVIYLVVALYIAWAVISFYASLNPWSR